MSTPQVKTGVKTTEFWLTIIGILGSLATSILSAYQGNAKLAVIAGVIAAVILGVYSASRVILKLEAAKITNWVPDDWEDDLEEILDAVKELADRLAPDEEK